MISNSFHRVPLLINPRSTYIVVRFVDVTRLNMCDQYLLFFFFAFHVNMRYARNKEDELGIRVCYFGFTFVVNMSTCKHGT